MWWRHANLDVCGGALACGYLAFHLTGQAPPTAWWIALPAAVWTIYTGDRLLDAARATPTTPNESERHQWHDDNKRWLWPLCIAMALISGCAAWNLPSAIWPLGFAAGACGLVHMTFGRRVPVIKEVNIAIGYAIGTFGPAYALAPTPLPHEFYFWATAIALCAWVNVCMFAYFEYHDDQQSASRSLFTFSPPSFHSLIKSCIVFVSSCILIGLTYLADNRAFIAVTAVLFIAQIIPLCGFRNWWQCHARYRLIGDYMFILPCSAVWL